MFELTDRVPAIGKVNRKKITHSDGSVEYVTIENADDANPVGTPLNKATFEAMQTATMPVAGSYVGNGEATKTITFDFSPSFLIFYCSFNDGALGSNSSNFPLSNVAIIKQGENVTNYYQLSENVLALKKYSPSNGGFYPNNLNKTYYYIAFKE